MSVFTRSGCIHGDKGRDEELTLFECCSPKVAAILKLFASEDKTLLIRRDTLVLDLRLDVVDRIRRFHLEGDGISGQGLDKDLHATVGRRTV